MRKRLLLALSVLAGTAACTSLLGDFSAGSGSSSGGSSSGGNEASTDSPVGDDAGEAGTVAAAPVGVSVFLGQKATADGTQSTPSPANGGTYAWQLGAPSGSSLTTADLQGASTPTVTFTPDVLGEYALELTVSAFGTSDSQKTTLKAVLPQVFYAQGTIADGGSSASYMVVDYDGGNVHSVICPDTAVTTVPNEIATFAAYAGRAYDFWESANVPSKLAGFTMNYQSGQGYSTQLNVTNAAATCTDGGATIFSSSAFGPGRPYGSMPHFSPDGTRVAVYDDKWNIVTYPSEGQNPVNQVAKYPLNFGQGGLDPSGASSLNGYVQEPPRIEWIHAQTADGGVTYGPAWAIPQTVDGGLGWAIVTAPDATSASPTPYVTCPGIVPRHFSVLADGSVIASYRQTTTGPEDIIHLGVVSGQCKQLTNYTSLPNNPAAVATDFDVSPDGALLAYLRIDPGSQDAAILTEGSAMLPGGYVYTVPVAGGTPNQFSVDPVIYGPRFIGGGGWMVFTRLDGVVGDAAVGSGGQIATSIVVRKVGAASTPQIMAKGDGVTSFASTSGSGSCSMAPGEASRAAAWGLAMTSLLAFAGFLRRRLR